MFSIQRFGKLFGWTISLCLISNFVLPPLTHAYERAYTRDFLIDQFIEEIQIKLEKVRDIEDLTSAPITKSDIDALEDKYDDIFDVLDYELIRVSEIELSQRERLEVESVLQEIYLQFDRTLDEIDNKTESNAGDDFDSLKENILSKALSYQGRLDEVLDYKLEGSSVTKASAKSRVSKTTEDLDVVTHYLENIADDFERLEDDISGTTATSSSVNSFYREAKNLLEDAENETRTLDYVSQYEKADFRAAVRSIKTKADDFFDAIENDSDFINNFADKVFDIGQIIEYGERQLTNAYDDVIANLNNSDISAYDAIEELDKLIEDVDKETRDLPDDEIVEIYWKVKDFLDDYEEDNANDLKESIEELRSEFSITNASTVEEDFEEDIENSTDYLLEGFSIIIKGTFTTSVGKVLTSLDGYKTEIDSIKSGLESNISDYDDFEDIEEDLEHTLYKAKNSIFELNRTAVTPAEMTTIETSIDQLGTATSETLDDLEDRISSGLSNHFDELVFDLTGGLEGESAGVIADSRFNAITGLYNTASSIEALETLTNPTDVKTFITSKINSLNSIENGWGNTSSSKTEYREAEYSLSNLLNEINYEINRLVGYSFEKSINSEIIVRHIGHALRNLINESEDVIYFINSSISSDERDDIEEKINDLYEDIDVVLSLLKDSSESSLDPVYTDIEEFIEDEKEYLNRAFNSISTSSGSSNNADSINDDFDENLSDILDISIPDPLDSYSKFDDIENDILNTVSDVELTLKRAYSKKFGLDDRESIQEGFEDVRYALEDFIDEMQDKKTDRVKRNVRTLKRQLQKDIIEFQLIMDDIEIEEEEDDDEYDFEDNVRDLGRDAEDVNFSLDAFTDMGEYHKELHDFRQEFRELEDELYILLEEKPAYTEDYTEENFLDDMETHNNAFKDGFDDTVGRFEDYMFDEDDDDYLTDSFSRYINRHFLNLSSLFEGAVNGYSATTVVYEGLYESTDDDGETADSSTEEDGTQQLEGVDTKFADVKFDNVFSPYIAALLEENSVSGYEDGYFHPERTVTRAEFIKMAIATKGVTNSKLKTDNINFLDVDKENALAPYIGYAISQGYINGYNDEYFGPNDPITRIDAIRILIRILNLVAVDFPQVSAYFSDITTPDLATLTDRSKEAGLISGFSDGTFGPYLPITRGETAKIIANAFLNLLN